MSGDRPPVCDYTGSNYQADFWDRGGRLYEDQVEEVALRRLLPPSGEMLLELGAGAGRNTPRYGGFSSLVLLDYSLTQLQQAQARLGRSERYTYVAADIYRLPFVPAAFDAATMIRTLHHMADAPLALQQVRQVLQPGAVFILEFANKHNLKAILRYLLHRQHWSPFTPEPVEFTALNYDFHPRAVRGWLQAQGFAIERQLTVSHFRMGLLKRLLPLKLLVGMDALMQPTGNWWQLTPSVFVRARAVDASVGAGSPGGFHPPTRPPITSLFCCPACGYAPLIEHPDALACPACGRCWAILDGIYNFREPV